ncbi:Plasmodium vivax Vir protein, putative [Plasmodium vivax]|uniref:Vir protein, putative n=1 Tax=Plasmodium vivax TaxID=5855 RepID=A0A1G4GSC3_PLAVI|nr:Plasmodium vivax Vir protein, putative [Plasmodium vivax]
MAFLSDEEGLKDKIPSLDDIDNGKFSICLSDEPKKETGSELRPAEVPAKVAGVGQEPHSQPISPASEQSNSPTSLSTSTVVSSIVGIPPFLALIYKFTPVGSMFRSKNNRNINLLNNLDDEIEKELFYPNHKTAITNSSLKIYNVAYGSV